MKTDLQDIIATNAQRSSGSPRINESLIETMGEGIILIEKGEYTCKTCTNILSSLSQV